MINEQKYSCMRELGAEVLILISSYILFFLGIALYVQSFIYNRSKNINKKKLVSDKVASFFLSSTYALFLPLMSYLFSQAKEYNLEGRAKIILIWMVLIEIIRVHDDSPFELVKSSEQLVRLFWVGFLVSSYTPLQGMRASLLLLCIYCFILEVLKAIMFNVGKNYFLIGKNPKLIHNYVKRIMLHDDLPTLLPMNTCKFIVTGEENHQIAVRSNGYLLREKKTNTEGMLTIDRVFELTSPEDEVFTSRYPYWRDTCLSHALAKMLRRRFAKLPVDEAGCRKALDFVLEGLIDYIGKNLDIQSDKNDGKRKPMERVFSIIQEELKLVNEFLQIRVPTCFYFRWYILFSLIGDLIMFGITLLLWASINNYIWDKNTYKHCSVAREIFSFLDAIITLPLSIASLFIPIAWGGKLYNERWVTLAAVKIYFKDPKWIRSKRSLVHYKAWELPPRLGKWIKQFICREGNVKEARVYSTLLDVPAETILFCIKVDVLTLARIPKWIRRIIPRSFPTVVHSTASRVAILMSLKNSAGRLTNGETSLGNHQMEDLKWACQPNGSTTEAILIWHIATTLLHHRKPSPDLHQEPAPERNNNTAFQNQEVALSLSSYCHYLVEYLPELLPDEPESTEEIYGSVRKEILAPPRSCFQKVTKKERCDYLLDTSLGGSSIVVKGVELANKLMGYADEGKPVWMMLADFWAEMMLFIAPSDNVEGHEQIINQEELITQIWALLTHAGIVTRPKPTKHQDYESESNAVTGDSNV